MHGNQSIRALFGIAILFLAAAGSNLHAQHRTSVLETLRPAISARMQQSLQPGVLLQDESPALPPAIGGFLGTGLGSLVGTFAGVLFGGDVFYDATGCCGGGDDPGLTSALAFGVAGTVVGGGIGGYLGTRAQKIPFMRMLAGSAGGMGAGFVVAALLSGLEADPAPTVGYFVAQAAFNGLNAHYAVKRRD